MRMRSVWQPPLWTTLGADSLDVFQIITGIEDEFDIEIDQQEAAKIRTVQEAVDYLETLTK